jgi:hypothetical protein
MDINEAIRLIKTGQAKVGETCELCGSKADGVGIFVPSEHFAKRIGQSEGKVRVALYPGCSSCQGKLGMPEYMRRIELVMEADYRQRPE